VQTWAAPARRTIVTGRLNIGGATLVFVVAGARLIDACN